MTHRRVFRVSYLPESDPGHALPCVGAVPRRAARVSFNALLGAPLPHVPPPVLADGKDDVASDLVEGLARHLIRTLQHGELLIGLTFCEDVRVPAPVVLEVVDAPLRERLK